MKIGCERQGIARSLEGLVGESLQNLLIRRCLLGIFVVI